MIIHNIPQDITAENMEETILAQNPELGLVSGNIGAQFTFKTQRGQVKVVIEVELDIRKKLLHKKLKIGWLICNVDNYRVIKRCFKCSKFSHRHPDCKGEETCPLCAGGNKLKECKALAEHYKCINSMTYNRYSKTDKISENHSSLDKNYPSMQAVLVKYRLNTEY
jgi:hypothetical protein